MAYAYAMNAPCTNGEWTVSVWTVGEDDGRGARRRFIRVGTIEGLGGARKRRGGRRDAPRRRPARDACRERKRRKRRRALRRRDSKTHARVRRACDDTARESKETGIANMSVVAKRLEENKASGGFFVFFFMHSLRTTRFASPVAYVVCRYHHIRP